MNVQGPLPHWDLSNVYGGLEADDYRRDFQLLDRGLSQLAEQFDAAGVGRLAELPADSDGLRKALVGILDRANELGRLCDTLSAFVYAFFSTDSYNTTAAREMSKLELLGVRRQKLDVRLRAWIGSLAPRLDAWISQDPLLGEHQFFLRNSARRSRYLMSEPLEALAAELCIDAGGAFGKLQGSVTSQLMVPLERDGKTERLPITAVRNLVFDLDPLLRERAYQAEQAGWESIRTTVAACLNGVKGTALTLARRRGWPNVLDAAIDDNRIDRPTLDALLGAIDESLPVFRRYLRAKATKLGLERLRWWDLFAPVGGAARRFSWPQASQFIAEKFSTFSDEMGSMAHAAFEHRWIDAEPRSGKRGGAFCMSVEGVEESRILANFDGSFDQVSTLAHELGHAYHNHCQRGLPSLLRGAPSTLAETASIFCETLIAEEALSESNPQEQLAILEAQLSGATQVCLDIRSRFQFEQAVFVRRAECELSAEEFCAAMLEAQAATYGDAIDPATYHRYMWLWKPHYYAHEHNFYNFPYAFGHLFSLGLYAVYGRDGASFVPRYDALLRATNQDYAAPLAARFGIDITQPDFWRESLRVIAEQVERFERL
ncbi:MAG TPA: M3 family oligoendopeptidase [Pirellulales bacterium]|jgi:pepF/M3 family oligoendopeptidase|nr:M3 family oligoendopeptidase [Pirellulales bacterium]